MLYHIFTSSSVDLEHTEDWSLWISMQVSSIALVFSSSMRMRPGFTTLGFWQLDTKLTASWLFLHWQPIMASLDYAQHNAHPGWVHCMQVDIKNAFKTDHHIMMTGINCSRTCLDIELFMYCMYYAYNILTVVSWHGYSHPQLVL